MDDDFKIKIDTSMLEKQLTSFEAGMSSSIKAAAQVVAEMTFAKIYEKAALQGGNKEHVKKYLDSLRFNRINDSEWVISLEGDFPNQLEIGVPAHDMRENLKSGASIKSGPRAGQPWVKKSKEGHKYAAVPISHKLSGVNKSDMASAIKSLSARGRNGVVQNVTQVYRDANSGVALTGKVATATNTGIANLENLTKYQTISKSGKVKSAYMIYRTLSENPDSKGWQHAGYPAINALEGIDEFIEASITDILSKI